MPGTISLAEKPLPGQGFLGRETSGWEMYPGQRNPWPGKVSVAEKSLAWKGIWEKFSSWERFHGQRNLCLVKVSGKTFPDCIGSSGKVTGKGFLGIEISAQEKFPVKILFLGKVSWADNSPAGLTNSFRGKVSLAEKSLTERFNGSEKSLSCKGFWEEFSRF